MFAEVKSQLPVSGNGYDRDIIIQIRAAVADLTKTSDIVLPGVVNISISDQGVIKDNSTLKDEYAITAIALWCNMHIGNPPNYDNLSKSYYTIKGNMKMSHEYKAEPEGAES